MRLTYVLLSPTYGMHQYAADLANRMAQAGHDVHLLTTTRAPLSGYLPAVTWHTPVDTRNSGFSPDALRPAGYRAVLATLRGLQPDLVHFVGPHLWNAALLTALRRQGVPTLHTLHDLAPHSGTAYGRLLHLWNRAVAWRADHILVHGACQRDALVAQGLAPERVTHVPLLHLFCGPGALDGVVDEPTPASGAPWALLFGRLEGYKGITDLLAAAQQLPATAGQPRIVVAGAGRLGDHWTAATPPGVELRDHFIADAEAIDLFRRCALLVLPYRDASQSALVAAAYYFRKPVIVTRVGALPEYVEEGVTGWVVAPGQPAQLARVLAEALSDPARLATMGAAGRAWYERERAVEWHTLQSMYSRLVDPIDMSHVPPQGRNSARW